MPDLNKSGARALEAVCVEQPEAAEAGLLQRSKGGDASAFDALITRHRQNVFMTAYLIIRNEDDALDVCQDTFLRAWRGLARFDGKQAFGAWLRRIATNAAIDLCRARRRRPEASLEEGSLRPDPASRTTPASPERPGRSLERAELRARLEAALSALSPEHRAVIALREFEGLSYEEIAAATSTTHGTVMSRLFYARKKLQHLLADLRHD